MGGTSIGIRNGIVTITDPDSLTDSSHYLLSAFNPYPQYVEIFGGTGAVSQDVEDAIWELLVGPLYR